jgi:DNA-binding CsgD family transcriptional regulator
MTPVAVAERWPLVGRRSELARFSATLADPGYDAFVIHGPPGVGKTRLADECLEVAERAGRACGRATANVEAGAVPLGAIAHLLSADLRSEDIRAGESLDPVQVFARAKRAFAERGEGAQFVLMVDDLHLLDVTSATLLGQLVVTGVVFLIATVPVDLRAPTSVTALWRGDRCHRVDLGDLARDSVETLLHLALGAPVDGPAAHALWSTSGGNVLFLRELVLGARQSGALVDEGGVWRLAGRLTSTPRLNELVASRVARVDENGRRALDLLALCAPVGPDVGDGVATTEVLETLEDAGLVTVTPDGRRRQLRLAHPVYRAVLRDRMPELRRRAMLLDQVGAIERLGARRREDGLRIATWRLEATGEADPALLVEAARLARYAQDYPRVVRLAGAAQAQRPGPVAGVLMGEALFELGSFFEADVELSRAGRLAEDDDDRVAVAVARAANLVWGLLRADDALAVNRAAQGAVVGQAARNELIAHEACILVFSGRPAKALELIETLPRVGTPRGRVLRALAEAFALSLAGFPDRALDVARHGHEDHLRLSDQPWVDHPGGHVLAQVLAMSDAGRLAEAADCAKNGYAEASASQVPLLQIRFALHSGRVALLSGRARSAKRWYREAVARSEATGFKGPRSDGLSGLAVAHGLLGDAEAAGKAVGAMDEVHGLGVLRPERAFAEAWWLVASGDPSAACSVLSTGAEAAAQSGHLTAASWMLHDMARLGQAAAVVDRLEDLARSCDSPLVATRAAHARALVTSDVDALGEVADRLEAMGALLVAAEAAAAASHAAARSGLGRRSSAFATRAVALAGRCEGARTAGLLGTDVAVALTAREREVAAMAASGVPSRDIAARLFLSVRTVNNHLQRVYAKLGVASRGELLASFDYEPREDMT